ncbi:ATP-binding protein [Hyalangium versicolor]|uniref:ATP-binding protein n=1 Tax=Hyalangium versicolor TaxID=2861190 RepID=UPI001CCFC227|nr:ATP-binding protein [Hyalangium versicolor]
MVSIAEIIRRHHDEILESWVAQAKRAASARGLTQPELTNMMPVYLALLAQHAPGAPDSASASARRRELIEGHIGWRLRQGFHIAEVAAEFALLGQCISRFWRDRSPTEQPAPEEIEWLYGELNHATTLVTDLFHEHMRDDEQTEKRYLRLLRSIANESLRTPEVSFKEQLRDVMLLVMEAMGAQTAALLLYEPHTNRLVTTASVGVGNGEFEQYVVSLGVSSFAGKTAEREEPTTISDVATTTLEVGDALRRSGIHGLLGVRLPPRFKLLGVIYVGTSEERTFTAREGRRLESLAEQLTLQLDNAQLYKDLLLQSEDLRVERDLRERFVSVLAHDLRGPLASVKAAAQLLLRQAEALGTRKDLASRIDRNVRRMDQMIRDLLDASRVQVGGQLPLRLDTCELDSVAREVLEELREVHGDRFILDADSGVRGCWSAEELGRALWNLAVNAIKYGAKDRPITLTVRRGPAGAWFSVHNEGPVISRENQAHLFEPFSRSHGSPTNEGWGLGLFLVQSCAQAHGGSVRVQSEASAGTTFTVELPWDARPYQYSVSEGTSQEGTAGAPLAY